MNIEELLKSFLWVLKVDKGISINTYRSYSYDFSVFLLWFNKEQCNLCNADWGYDFSEYLRVERKNSVNSIVRKINLINNFCKFCNKEKGCSFYVQDSSFKRNIKIYRPYLEKDDFLKIRKFFLSHKLDAKLLRIQAIVEILYSTGLRVSELLSLTKNDFLEAQKKKSIIIIGKGMKKRSIFFNKNALAALENYLEMVNLKSIKLFPVSRQRVFQILKDFAKKLDINLDTMFPHSFRHRLLSDLVQQGMNLIDVQRIAGHEQISTTEKYTHVEDFLYEEIYKYHPLASKFTMCNK